MTETPDATITLDVTKEYADGSGQVRTVEITAGDGKRFHVVLTRGWIQWADLEVWDEPAKYGLTRYTCPGHNGHVCYYGMCDEIRFGEPAWLARQGYPVGIQSA